MGKIYTLNEERSNKADRAIVKLITLAQCMDKFDGREEVIDMISGFKYILETATSELRSVVFWEDTHD